MGNKLEEFTRLRDDDEKTRQINQWTKKVDGTRLWWNTEHVPPF
jgi:hypothetical protein